MFDYKRLSFFLVFLSIFLISTDTNFERQARRSLLSFFDIVVEEGSSVGETAPSSFLDTLETGRIGTYKYLNKQDDILSFKIDDSKSFLSLAYSFAYYIVLFFKFICSYVITFYPSLIFLLYAFFTSRFFRRDDFPNY